MKVNDQILVIIANELEGRATAEQKEQLQQWLRETPENFQAYNELITVWQRSEQLLQQPAFDTDNAWNKLDTIIRLQEQSSAKIVSFSIRKWMSAAAAILLFTVAGWWGYHQYHSRPLNFTASVNNESITLPDGSVVMLRKGSKLSYPANFTGYERNVSLEGEAFFQVQHNEHQPFNISTSHSVVTVLGTSFVVDTDNNTDKVFVVTGRVKVASTSPENDQVILTAGQEVLVEAGKLQQSEVKDSNFMAWRTGILDFKDAALPKVLKDIEHYYKTPLSVDPGTTAYDFQNVRLNVQFRNQSLDQVVDEITLLTGLSVKKAKDSIIFYKK